MVLCHECDEMSVLSYVMNMLVVSCRLHVMSYLPYPFHVMHILSSGELDAGLVIESLMSEWCQQRAELRLILDHFYRLADITHHGVYPIHAFISFLSMINDTKGAQLS